MNEFMFKNAANLLICCHIGVQRSTKQVENAIKQNDFNFKELKELINSFNSLKLSECEITD